VLGEIHGRLCGCVVVDVAASGAAAVQSSPTLAVLRRWRDDAVACEDVA